jgi:hypothetical protein
MRFLVAALLAVAAPASAGEKMLLRSVEFTGPGAADAPVAELRHSLVGGLAAAGFELVPETSLSSQLEKSPELRACTTDTCIVALATAFGARWGLTVDVEVIARGTLEMRLRIVDAKTGKALHEQPSCNACSTEEVDNWMSSAGPLIRQRLEPLIAAVAPPVAPPPPIVEERPSGAKWAMRGLGIAAGALGLSAFIAGFVEVGRNGSDDCASAATGVCARKLDTTNAQIFSFVSGTVLLGAAAALSYFGWRHPKKPIALSPFGAGARLTLSF